MTDRIKENYTESIQTKIAAAEALPDAIHTAAQMITICLLNGHKVLACGNGPSAALAQLFISELVNCYETQRPSLPGMALT
ncbi:MAG: SIS domain-containing protein, partial [Aeromonas sobria]